MGKTEKVIRNLLTSDWKDELKKLPKYQKKEIFYASKIIKQIEFFKFDVISLLQLKKELRKIIGNK